MHVSGLFIYPVKSLRGCAVAVSDMDELGLVGDRRFLVVDPAGQFLTQRVLPRMALITTAYAGNALILGAAGSGSIAVPVRVAHGATLRRVTIWKSEGLAAEDCGDEPAKWLTALLETPCRLVRIGDQFRRPVLKDIARPGDVLAFQDSYPLMAISEASLADLNQRLVAAGATDVPMDRFRPNIVIANAAPYDEDTWPRLRIGDMLIRAATPCARCIVTTTNQATAERGTEPLRTLAMYRRDPEDATWINFGRNFIHETKRGTLRVGETVTILPVR